MTKCKMTDEEKNRADVLVALQRIAWDNFERRRAYHWKFNLGIWTALAALAGMIFTRGPIWFPGPWWGVLLFSALIGFGVTVVHGYWLWQVISRDRLDKTIAVYYETLTRNLLEVEFREEVQRLKKSISGKDYWSCLAAVPLTVLLAVVNMVAFLVSWSPLTR